MLEERLWLNDGKAKRGECGICRNPKGFGTMSIGTRLRHHEKDIFPFFLFYFILFLNFSVGNVADKKQHCCKEKRKFLNQRDKYLNDGDTQHTTLGQMNLF